MSELLLADAERRVGVDGVVGDHRVDPVLAQILPMATISSLLALNLVIGVYGS